MKGELKNGFNSVKTGVKNAWDKTSDADKAKIQKDIKDKNLSGAAETVKEQFRKSGKA